MSRSDRAVSSPCVRCRRSFDADGRRRPQLAALLRRRAAVGARLREEQRRRARVPAGLGLLLPDGLRRAGERRRPRREGAQDDVLRASRATAIARSGTARGRGSTAPRSTSAPTRRSSSAIWPRSCRISCRTGAASTTGSAAIAGSTSGCSAAIDRVRARSRTGVFAPTRDRRSRGDPPRDAPSQDHRRGRYDAGGRADHARGARGRDGAGAPGDARVRGRGAAPRHVPPARLGAAGLRQHRRLRVRTRASCTTGRTTGRSRRATCS